MRNWLAALPLFALAACGGGGTDAQTAGSVAPPTGSGGTGTAPTPTPAHFLDVSVAKTTQALGGLHSLEVTETGVPLMTGNELYQGNASTVRTGSGEITYDPRDGIFTVTLADQKAGVNLSNTRFQDPAHRTDFGGRREPQWGVPKQSDVPDFNFLQSAGGEASETRFDGITFFYQRPGSQTAHVSLAGYVHNTFTPGSVPLANEANSKSRYERGAFVFGDLTTRSQVPVSGTAAFSGGLLATMVTNTSLDAQGYPTYFQWIIGTSTINVDFGAATWTLGLSGRATAASSPFGAVPDARVGVPEGSLFSAQGGGKINLTGTGGFTGEFASAFFTRTTTGEKVPVYDRVNPANSTAGANSIDGAFYGPNGVNVGGGFRLVGGRPDQRVDILGAFTGAKK